MLLSELLSHAGVTPDRLSGDAEIDGMVMDSRKARPGSLFTAMPSKNSDSHSFISGAKERGATAVLAHSDEGFEAAISAGLAAVLIRDEGLNFNEAVWRLAKVAFGNPSASMKIVGVTGTNGKTTTAWLIRDMLTALGVKAGYLGTLGFQIPGEERELQNTTPFSIELNELLAEARDKGVEAMAIEVSSHALAERRVDGIEFDAAVFTNLTQDHLDFHGSMEAYEAAKLRFFTELPKQSLKEFGIAINVGDRAGLRIARKMVSPACSADRNVGLFGTFSRFHSELGAIIPESVHVALDKIEFQLPVVKPGWDRIADRPPSEIRHFEAHLGGEYNVENLLAASTGLLAAGWSIYDVHMAMPSARPVPGRFEAVPNDAGIGILVDYAHTPDALEKLLDAVRPLTQGRIITVFGCGGDRDRNKRPKMAKAASERSDVTVVTSDNPRTEDPQAILDEVLTGIVPGPQSVDIIDRREAIAFAIQIAQPGDVVVIAGKGHENYQIIGRTKYPMDDRELAREGLAKRGRLEDQ